MRAVEQAPASPVASRSVTAPIIPGCEPWSADGGSHGVLVLHGYTGNPQSMRPLAEAAAAAGYTVDLPLLAGHGTAIEDLLPTRWEDWSGGAEAAYEALAARCDKVVVTGLSMGGTLTSWLAGGPPAARGPPLPALDPVQPRGPRGGAGLRRRAGALVRRRGRAGPPREQLPRGHSRQRRRAAREEGGRLRLRGPGRPRHHRLLMTEPGRLTRDDVAHVASLARLHLSDEELDLFTGQLAEVLDHASDVASLDLAGVAPTAHAMAVVKIGRA